MELLPVARGKTRKKIAVCPREGGGDDPVITRSTASSPGGRWPSPTAASGTVRIVSYLSAYPSPGSFPRSDSHDRPSGLDLERSRARWTIQVIRSASIGWTTIPALKGFLCSKAISMS